MELFFAALTIFLLRVIDQSLGTMRSLLVAKNKPIYAALIGLVESAIWIVAISQVIRDLDSPFLVFGYALGFASGTIVGSYIESSIAIGDVVVRIFSPKDEDSLQVADTLRSEGFGVTIISGEGRDGEVSIAWCVAPRKKVKQVLKIVSTINPDAYVTTESTSPINLTSNRK